MEAERVMIEEARMITGLPERTLQSLSARGEIWGAAKLGRRWTYDRMRLRAWVRANEAATEGQRTSISEKGGASGTPAHQLAGSHIASLLKQEIAAKLRGD